MDLTGTPHDHWNRHGGLEETRGPGLPDPGVWRWDENERCYALAGDPWPWVQVREVILGARGRVLRDDDGEPLLGQPRWCKEARVRGSAGWLRKGSRAHTGNYEAGER
jgi:hypothetical protein